jgi:1-acyl-sn-glycerol-3-phosphate acyltransferase
MIRRYQRMLELYVSYYRPEIRGFENVPKRGPFLVIGNHSGGAATPDIPILMTKWWRERGVDEPVYGLFHSMFLNLPGLKEPLTKFGALEAGWEAAEAVLRDGGIVLVYPGGDYEAFRPWSERNRIDFAGRSGFVKLALRTGVPIVPAVSIGVHESVFVLSRGDRIARALPHLRRWRLKVMPVMVGPPWGISFGLPTIPVPAKVTVQLGPPIDLAAELGSHDPAVDAAVKEGYHRVTTVMQRTLDELAAERRRAGPWPLSLLRPR